LTTVTSQTVRALAKIRELMPMLSDPDLSNLGSYSNGRS